MAPVTLNVYDVSTDSKVGAINHYLEAIGTGAFHGGLEVYGKEYSYGYAPDKTGVFICEPKDCKCHNYRESIDLGQTSFSPEQVEKLVEELKLEWPGFEYDLLRRNCVLFCSEFAKRLGAKPVPSWVTNLSGAGATVADGFHATKQAVDHATIIAKAKAGEIDEKYNISGTAKEAAKEFLTRAGKFDEEYKVRERAFAAAVALQTKASEFGQAVSAEAGKKFEEADIDKDGQISFEEARAYLNKKAAEASVHVSKAVGDLKAKVDKDGDGHITAAEVHSHCGECAGCTLQ